MCMYPISNGFRDRTISLYSSKIVDKKIQQFNSIQERDTQPRTQQEAHKDLTTTHVSIQGTYTCNTSNNRIEQFPH
jgi:hypothetical protein